MSSSIRPFPIEVPQAAIEDLHRRLDSARWPERETVEDPSQGVPLERLRELVAYWRETYDWRRAEAWLNGSGSAVTSIDGLDIHFLHIRSPHEDATPLLLTHGWPGAVFEFRDVAQALTNPTEHGGSAADAFHLVIPSLPGYGFSGKPDRTGWSVNRIAAGWAELMARLGYDDWIAQGGDWGAVITTALGALRPAGLAGVHVNLPLVLPADPQPPFSPEEQAMLDALARYASQGAGYSTQQATRPQTLGYALADSPVGQAAWIYEKFGEWADCGGYAENALSRERMLDVISHYWLTNSGASSARLYWESFAGDFTARELSLPAGCSIFPGDLYRAPRSWAQRCMKQLIYWSEPPRGGHFAAMEQPELFAEEMRAFRRALAERASSDNSAPRRG